MERTFTWSTHPLDKRIARVHAVRRGPTTPEVLAQSQVDIREFHAWMMKTFGDAPILLMTVLENMGLAFDKESEMATHGSLAMAQIFNIERAAYVTDGATLRLQFNRFFRENQLTGKFKVFPTEREAVSYLSGHESPSQF